MSIEASNLPPRVQITVYTDGACSGTPGPGGWAYVTTSGRMQYGSDPSTTNQRMELMAALKAIEELSTPFTDLVVVSDSAYVVNCFKDGWWRGWIRRDWRNSKGEPVANRDLWEPLIDLVVGNRVTFRKVKGHSGDAWNDRVDKLAVAAKQAMRGIRGPSLHQIIIDEV